jgi:dethiobiotin synthetase
VGDDGGGVLGVSEEAGHVGHEDEAFGLEGDGGHGGGDIGVAVVEVTVEAAGGGADDGGDALGDTVEQGRGVDLDDLADEAEIEGLAVGAGTSMRRARKMSGPANPRARPPSLLMVATISGLISWERTLLAISTVCASVTRWPWTKRAWRPAFSMARVMALPPPWTTMGLISTASRKTTSRATPLRMTGSGESMKRAAVFDDEGGAVEALKERQGFEEGGGLGDQILTDVAALKPLCSGDRKDAEMLRAAAGNVISLDEVNPWWFRAPLTPLLAARREGRRVRLAEVLMHVRAMRRRFSMVLLEGAGGLLSPLGKDFDALDLIVRLEARVLVVSVNRLGVVNQVLLTLRALPRDIAQDARVVLMTARRPDYSSRSNVRLLRELVEPGRVEVLPWLTAGQRRGGATLKLGARRALGRLTRYALGRGRAPARP